MGDRNEILSRLNRRPAGLPERHRHSRQYSNLAEQFSAALARSKGESYLVESKSAAVEKLRELLAELRIESVIAHREARLTELGIPGVFPELRWYFAGEIDDLRKRSAEVDLGLTSAEAAFAETGSLVLVSGSDKARMTSLLPPVHIVLLPETSILPSIFEWAENRPEEFPANLVLVSGPSKTADIEQTLIVGVHGPKRLIVIIYRE